MTQSLPALCDEIERLEREATPGQWRERINTHESTRFGGSDRFCEVQTEDGSFVFRGPRADEPVTEDARLVVALRNHCRTLTAAARELAAKDREIEGYRQTLNGLRIGCHWMHGCATFHGGECDCGMVQQNRRIDEALWRKG